MSKNYLPHLTLSRIPKLVIWDLDNTFWYGTLMEGGYRPIDSNIYLVRELTERGIINTIVSKNDYKVTKRALVDIGVWDYFVSPSIELTSKGLRVKEIVETLMFRAEDVLFIDDLPGNCAEASYFVPGIQVSTGDAIIGLSNFVETEAPSDHAKDRLGRYKAIVRRTGSRMGFLGDDLAFLRQAAIRIWITKLTPTKYARVADLLNRANQLNFTKSRVSYEGLSGFEAKFDRVFCVEAADRYGQHGIVGFVALKKGILVHFVFSCRVLNLGIEHFVYQMLGAPSLDVVAPVAYPINARIKVDWIRVEEQGQANACDGGNISVLVKGGCDIERIAHFMDETFEIEEQLNYVNDKGIPVHLENTLALRERSKGFYDALAESFNNYDFLESNLGTVRRGENRFDFMLHSLAMDFLQGIYESISSGAKIPIFTWDKDVTNASNWESVCSQYGLSRSMLEQFSAEFRFVGGVDAESMRDNLSWLVDKSGIADHYLLINGVEVDDAPEQLWLEVQRNREMNLSLDLFLADYPNVGLVDMRELIRSFRDCQDNLRHFKPGCYARIGSAASALIKARFKD